MRLGTALTANPRRGYLSLFSVSRGQAPQVLTLGGTHGFGRNLATSAVVATALASAKAQANRKLERFGPLVVICGARVPSDPASGLACAFDDGQEELHVARFGNRRFKAALKAKPATGVGHRWIGLTPAATERVYAALRQNGSPSAALPGNLLP